MMARRRHLSGFTLIELMVSLAVMALLALLSWRGIDGMARAQTALSGRMQSVAILQVGLIQWTADLDAIMETGVVDGMDYDGRVLRLTRYDASEDGSPLRVVAWSRRVVAGDDGALGRWTRWQSPPLRDQAALQSVWAQAQLQAQNPGLALQPGELVVSDLDGWQIFYFRNNTWSNPLSSAVTTELTVASTATSPDTGADLTSSRATAPLPEGVRLVLSLPAGQPVAGVLTKDWVRPVWAGDKS